MTALKVRLPEDRYERLKKLSKRRGISMNRLIDEMVTLVLAEFDAQARFALRTRRGQDRAHRGLKLLQKARGPSAGA